MNSLEHKPEIIRAEIPNYDEFYLQEDWYLDDDTIDRVYDEVKNGHIAKDQAEILKDKVDAELHYLLHPSNLGKVDNEAERRTRLTNIGNELFKLINI